MLMGERGLLCVHCLRLLRMLCKAWVLQAALHGLCLRCVLGAARALTCSVWGAGEALARKQRLVGQTSSKDVRKPADRALAAGAAAAARAPGRAPRPAWGAARVQARARPLPPATRAALLDARPSQASVRRSLGCHGRCWSSRVCAPLQHARPAACAVPGLATDAAHMRRAAVSQQPCHCV